MPGTRKLGKDTSHRKAMLRNLVTNLLNNGSLETTVEKAKEVKPLVDSIISLVINEKDNFVVAEKTISRVKLDKNGKKVTEKATSKNGKSYNKLVREVVKEKVNQDKPSRLSARRKIMGMTVKIKDSNGKNIDILKKLFEEIAPKYGKVTGGYTRILKLGPRRGDGAEMAKIELI